MLRLKINIDRPAPWRFGKEIDLNGPLCHKDAVRYRVTFEQDEDGVYVAECPALPGCVSQGKTRREALKNIREAIEGYLESLKKHNDPIPPPIEEEVVDVAI